MTGVADLVKEARRTAMLHNDMNLSRLMVYAQSFEKSKLSKILRNFNKGGSNEQNQPRSKKWAPKHDGPSDPKVQCKGGSSSQGIKTTCFACGNKHFGKCLVGTENCFGCGKDGHKVRSCPNIEATGKEDKQVPPCNQDGDAPKRNRFYALRAKA